MVPLPVPEGVTVHHDWLLEAVQAELEFTVKEVLPAGSATFWFEGLTLSVAACVVKLRSLPLDVPALFCATSLK
jgi:hypothetical protein